MKKLFLFTLLFLAVLPAVRAQDADVQKFRFGLKTQAAYSFLRTSEKGYDTKGRLGYGYGLITEFGLSDNYFIATGLEVNHIGGRLNFPDSTFIFDALVNDSTPARVGLSSRRYLVQYLDLPIGLKMRTNEIGAMRYFGQFGGTLGFRLKGKREDDYQFVFPAEPLDESTQEVGLFRVALNIGAGVEYNLSGNTNVVAGIFYNNGFNNIFSKKKFADVRAGNTIAAAPVAPNANLDFISLMVGVIF